MSEQQNKQVVKLASMHELLNHLEASGFPKKVRFNVRTTKYEYDGKAINFDCLEVWFCQVLGIEGSPKKMAEAIISYGEKNKYDPVREHFEEIESRHKDISEEFALSFFSKFAYDVLGIEKPLYIEYLKCFAIGGVDRIFDPGCKHDDALILQGKQGIGKSTFFRVLAGSDFFCDRLQGDLTNKDQIALLQRFFVLEWSELDKHFGLDRSDSIKAGLRAPDDDYRPPYGKEPKRVERRCLIVGTTNKQNFLKDETGNRTFHVIPVDCTIDIEKTKALRELFWACAIVLRNLKHPHYLSTPELKEAQRQDVAQFDTFDPWVDDVEAYVTKKLDANPDDWFKLEDFLVEKSDTSDKTPTKILRAFEDAKNDRSSQMRLGKILTRLGLEKKQKWIGSQNVRAWFKA
jgi:predicted P-loop ATPase